MRRRRAFLGLAAVTAALAAAGTLLKADPCAGGACCVNPAVCVVTDKQTLAGLTVDQIISCNFTLGTYVQGGNNTAGLAPANWPANLCGLSFSINAFTPANAINFLDHKWLQSTTTPKVMDLGSPVNTVFVFPAVDHGPFPEEGIESTVWGSSSPSLAGFPAGWTQATLTTIWKQGWEEPAVCEPGDNADDFTGQYSFAGPGFQYIAVHANFSISIFDDPTHATWAGSNDDSGVPGWQTHDDEIDAVGTPVCDPADVTADAGPDQAGNVGGQVCFDGSGSSASGGIATIGWDLDGNGTIDVNGAQACLDCTQVGEGDVTLFVANSCGCVDSDTAHFTCTACDDPSPLTQGYWHRQCLGAGLITPGRNGRGPQEVLEPDFLKTLVPVVDNLLQQKVFVFRTCEDGMDANPPSDPCARALKQYTALLLNVTSGRLSAGCGVDLGALGCSSTSIGDLVDELAALINSGGDDCKIAADCAGAVNENQGIVLPVTAPPAPGPDIPGTTDIVGTTPTTSRSDTPMGGGRAYTAPVADSAAAEAREPAQVERAPIVVVPETAGGAAPEADRAVDETAADGAADVTTIDRHLAILANAAAPERVRRASVDALLMALGGGYEPQVRLRIVRALFGQLDVAYHSLLAKHLEDIRDEAGELGHQKLAREAGRFLKRLGASVESTE